jgi:hypothetical protein
MAKKQKGGFLNVIKRTLLYENARKKVEQGKPHTIPDSWIPIIKRHRGYKSLIKKAGGYLGSQAKKRMKGGSLYGSLLKRFSYYETAKRKIEQGKAHTIPDSWIPKLKKHPGYKSLIKKAGGYLGSQAKKKR